MKTYRGRRFDWGEVDYEQSVAVIHFDWMVAVDEAGSSRALENHQLVDAFAWGVDDTDRKTNLARAILADYLGYEPPASLVDAFRAAHVDVWNPNKQWLFDDRDMRHFLGQTLRGDAHNE